MAYSESKPSMNWILGRLVGHASLWAVIAAGTGASLVVNANGLRLLKSS